jgi:2-phospho-L-lactate guanylyltransferase
MPIIAGVPVKSFLMAKKRLADTIDPTARLALSREMAKRTCLLLAEAGARPLVLAADQVVAGWAEELRFEMAIDDGSGLNGAARRAVAIADGRPWLIVHADLPLLDVKVTSRLIAAVGAGHPVIAPSRDGGTPVVGGSSTSFVFSYGPGSYHRHLRELASAGPHILVDPRLAIDLDEPTDLRVVRARVPWMAATLDSLAAS